MASKTGDMVDIIQGVMLTGEEQRVKERVKLSGYQIRKAEGKFQADITYNSCS